MPLKPRYSLAWAGWILGFLLIEGAALFDSTEGDTLSEHVWAFLDGGWSRYLLLGGFFSWLVIHFFGKGKAG